MYTKYFSDNFRKNKANNIWNISKCKKIIFIAIIAILLLVTPSFVKALIKDDLQNSLAQAYMGVQRAESVGYNVEGLLRDLNTAASLIDEGGDANISKAASIIASVSQNTPNVTSEVIQAQTTRLVIRVAILGVLGITALVIWFYGSRIYWWVWRKSFDGWRVESS